MDHTEEILQGRPYGGLAIMLGEKSLSHCIKPVQHKSNRICAVKMSLKNSSSVLFVCAYLACDNRSITNVDPYYIECFSEVDMVIEKEEFMAVVFGGDLNTDLSSNVNLTEYLKKTVINKNMFFGWQSESAVPCVTYETSNSLVTSTKVHFICSRNMFDSIKDVNHKPIKLNSFTTTSFI